MAKQVNPRRRRDNDAQRQQAQEEARRRAYRKAVRKRQIIGIGVLTAVVLAVVGTVGLAQSEKAAKPSTTPTSAIPTSTTTQLGSNAPPASLPTPAAGVSLTGDTPCPNEDGSSPRTTHFEKAPTGCIDPTREYNATIHTSKGDIVISLLPESSPKSVNNFVSLARYHYYDGLPITRIVPRGWAEIGDPAGPDGKPGPGYRVPGETQPQGSIATPLIVAMIPDASGTSGGAFLLGIADQAPSMPKFATQIGNILDSRVDHSPTGSPDKTVQQEFDKVANKSGQPTEVIIITGISIETTPVRATTTVTTANAG